MGKQSDPFGSSENSLSHSHLVVGRRSKEERTTLETQAVKKPIAKKRKYLKTLKIAKSIHPAQHTKGLDKRKQG